MIKIERLREVAAKPDHTLHVTFEDGYEGFVDIKPFMEYEAFKNLGEIEEFMKLHNGGYFVEWKCGADLSADTLRSRVNK